MKSQKTVLFTNGKRVVETDVVHVDAGVFAINRNLDDVCFCCTDACGGEVAMRLTTSEARRLAAALLKFAGKAVSK